MTADTAPIATAVSNLIPSLPLYPAMSRTDIDDTAAAVRKIATAYQR
ncbi:DegT/DnrJ/EryC1/StrS family aminotransferase [Nocardia sp. NBC_01377]